MQKQMTRAERRRLQKAKRKENVAVMMKVSDVNNRINQVKDELRKENLKEDTVIFCKIMAYCLSEEFGFGKKRIEQFCERFKFECKCMGSRHLNLNDIEQVLKNKKVEIK